MKTLCQHFINCIFERMAGNNLVFCRFFWSKLWMTEQIKEMYVHFLNAVKI